MCFVCTWSRIDYIAPIWTPTIRIMICLCCTWTHCESRGVLSTKCCVVIHTWLQVFGIQTTIEWMHRHEQRRQQQQKGNREYHLISIWRCCRVLQSFPIKFQLNVVVPLRAFAFFSSLALFYWLIDVEAFFHRKIIHFSLFCSLLFHVPDDSFVSVHFGYEYRTKCWFKSISR